MLPRMHLIFAIAATIVLGALVPAQAAKLTISGDVTYRERIALPSGAALSISLVDLAHPDEPRVTAKGAVAERGQVPLSFSLNFDEAVLSDTQQYGLVAEILGPNGGIRFRSAEPLPVDPRAPATPLQIIVTYVGEVAPPAPPAPPVLDQSAAFAPFFDVTWRAESIGGVATLAGVNSTLAIAPDMRAGGRGGCNSWFAQAEIVGEGLVFSAVAATRMACTAAEAMAQETGFFSSLAETRFWRLRGDKLVLFDAAGADLAILVRYRS